MKEDQWCFILDNQSYSVLISFFVLLVVMLIKYSTASDKQKRNFIEYFIDFPIDLISIFLAVTFSRVVIVEDVVCNGFNYIISIVVSIVVMIICSGLRCKIKKNFDKGMFSANLIALLCVDYIIAALSLLVLVNCLY